MPYTPPDSEVSVRTYVPQVNDYVKWHTHPYPLEGWVYFKSEYYITIEIGVKCKDEENIKDCSLHEKTHTLVVCYPQYYHELEYVKSRPSKYHQK